MLRHCARVCLVIALLGLTQRAAPAQSMPPYYTSPYASDDSASTWAYNESVVIYVLSNDYGMNAPLDPSSIVITTPPVLGEVTINLANGEVTYVPDGHPDGGYDLFEYTVTDELGQVSNVAEVAVWVEPNRAPMIYQFYAYQGLAGVWHFVGTVYDEDIDVMEVKFGGILQGESCGINPDGSFHFAKLIEGPGGLVTAKAIDPYGLESNEQQADVGY